MSLDPRSRERLEALGRRLPQPLPAPAAKPAAAPRHRLEVEQDPEQLFRELMAASPDGSVPPHHLERLRQLEGQRSISPPEPAAPGPGTRQSRPPKGRRQSATSSTGDGELYAAFAQLLLEQEGDD
jgi:hypothetical protein